MLAYIKKIVGKSRLYEAILFRQIRAILMP